MEWTFAENKTFENAIAELGLNCPNLVQQLALRLPGKTIDQIQMHFDSLVKDVEMIEMGKFDKVLEVYDGGSSTSQLSQIVEPSNVTSTKVKRKKGIPWTDDDHERFLRGLERYGKGDWKSISRNCVLNKTPSQVASHAQKYFLKLKRSYAKQHEAETKAQHNS